MRINYERKKYKNRIIDITTIKIFTITIELMKSTQKMHKICPLTNKNRWYLIFNHFPDNTDCIP